MNVGDWFYSPEYNQTGQVVEVQTLWGETLVKLWLPAQEQVVRVQADALQPLVTAQRLTPHHLTYAATTARVAETLTQPNVLLAPLTAPVIPLPHQIQALQRAISGNQVRYLLADEVGLGKTIEAGLVQSHREWLGQAQVKKAHVFTVWRQVIERIGLPEVRAYRLAQFEQEEKAWQEQLDRRAKTNPELVPLLVLRVEKLKQQP